MTSFIAFLPIQQKKFNFILLQVNQKDSPSGLYRRIKHYEIESYNTIGSINIDGSDSIALRTAFLKRFYNSFNLDIDSINTLYKDAKFSDLYLSTKFDDATEVVIGLEKNLYQNKKDDFKLLEWFVNTYCSAKAEISGPTFIFIVQLFANHPKAKYRKTPKIIEQFSTNRVIEVYKKISRQDIKEWIHKYLVQVRNKEDKIIEEHFPGRQNKQFDMEFIEERLKRIIINYQINSELEE